jgi:hypothetical protein
VPESEVPGEYGTAPRPVGAQRKIAGLFEQTLTKEKAKHNIEILRKAREQQAKSPAQPS